MQTTFLELKYIPDGALTEEQQKYVDFINTNYLSGDHNDPKTIEIIMYDWGAPEDGMFLLFENEKVIGQVTVLKTLTEYDGQEYCLGGFGGLAVLPEYRGKGYGRLLAEVALARAREIGVDVACMCVDMDSGITAFYERLGFKFLNRPAYFINWADKEKSDDTVMIMGLNNAELADKILNTTGKFHYGKSKGHW